MPLQVRIEEGPRSKSVRVGGLQYCQYSQEKISLITLLSDHVLNSVFWTAVALSLRMTEFSNSSGRFFLSRQRSWNCRNDL